MNGLILWLAIISFSNFDILHSIFVNKKLMLNLSEINSSFFYVTEHIYLLLYMTTTYDLHNIYIYIYMLKNGSIEYKLFKYLMCIRKNHCLYIYNLGQKRLIYILTIYLRYTNFKKILTKIPLIYYQLYIL